MGPTAYFALIYFIPTLIILPATFISPLSMPLTLFTNLFSSYFGFASLLAI